MPRRSEVNETLERERSQLVRFTNFSDKDFVWKWGGHPYITRAKKTYLIELFKAELFATHLIDRELNSLNVKTNDVMRRKAMLMQCIDGIDLNLINDKANLNNPILEEDEALMAEAEELGSFMATTEGEEEIAVEQVNAPVIDTEPKKELTETEKNEALALEMRDNGEHWKIVETKTGVSAERQRELIMKGLPK